MSDDTWWQGNVQEKSGWFPSAFVRVSEYQGTVDMINRGNYVHVHVYAYTCVHVYLSVLVYIYCICMYMYMHPNSSCNAETGQHEPCKDECCPVSVLQLLWLKLLNRNCPYNCTWLKLLSNQHVGKEHAAQKNVLYNVHVHVHVYVSKLVYIYIYIHVYIHASKYTVQVCTVCTVGTVIMYMYMYVCA